MDGKNSSDEKRKSNKPPDSGELQRKPSKELSFVSDGNFEELLALAQCDTCGQPVHLHECKPKHPNLKENAADKERASVGLVEKDKISKGQQKRDSGSIVLLQPNAKRLATEGKIIQEQSGASPGVKVSPKSAIEAKPDTSKQPPSTYDDSYHQLLSLGQCSHCDKPIHPGACEEGEASAVGKNMQFKGQDEGKIAPKNKDEKRGSGCRHADHSKGSNNTNAQGSDIGTKSNKIDPPYSDNANPIQEVSKNEDKKIPEDARLSLQAKILDSHDDSTQYSLDAIDVRNESVSVQTSSFQSPQASVVSKVVPVPESNAVTNTSDSSNTENDTPTPGKESDDAKVVPLPENEELLFSDIKAPVPTDFSTSDIVSIENVPPINDNAVPDQMSTDKHDLENQPQISQSLPSTIQSISITSEDVSELINTTLASAQEKNSLGNEECPPPPEGNPKAQDGQDGSLALEHKNNIIVTETQDKASEEQCIEAVDGELGKNNDMIKPPENSVVAAAQTLEKTTTTETDLHEKGVMTEKAPNEKKRVSETPHEKAVMTEPPKKFFKPEQTEKGIMTDSPVKIKNATEAADNNISLPTNGGNGGIVKQLEDVAGTSINENQTDSDFYAKKASIVSWGANEIFEPVHSSDDRNPAEFSSESENIIRMMKMRIATAKDKEVKVECLRQSRSTIECTIKTLKPADSETSTTVADSIPDLTNSVNNHPQASQPEQDETENQNPLSGTLPTSQQEELGHVSSKFNLSYSDNVNPTQEQEVPKGEKKTSAEGSRFPPEPSVDSQDDSTQYSLHAINVRDESVSVKPSYVQLPEPETLVVPTNVLPIEEEPLHVSRPLPDVNSVGVAEPRSVRKSQLQPITEEDLSTLAPAETLEIRVAQHQENTLRLPQEQTEKGHPITESHQLKYLSPEELWTMENAVFETDHRINKKSVESEGEHELVDVVPINESDEADMSPEKLWKIENAKRDLKSLHRIGRMYSIQSEGGKERSQSTQAARVSEPEGRGSLSKDYTSFHIKKGEGFLGLEYALPEETISVVTYYESSSGSDQEDVEQLQLGIVEKAQQVKDLVSTKRLGLLQVQSDHIIRLANEVITTHHAKSATDVGKSQDDDARAWDALKSIRDKDRVDRFAKNIILVTVESEEILNKLKTTNEYPTPVPRGEAADHLSKMIKKLHCRHKKLRNMAEEIVAKRWKLLNLKSNTELGKKKDEKKQKKKKSSDKSKNAEKEQKRKAEELKTLYSNPLARVKQVGVGVSAGQGAWTETDPLWKAVNKVGKEQVEKCLEWEKVQAKNIDDNDKEPPSRRDHLSDQLRQSVLTILTNNFSKLSAGRLATNVSPKTSDTAHIFDRNNAKLINNFVDQWKRRCYSIGIMTVIITALLQCLYLSGPRMGDNYMTYTMVDSLSGSPFLCPTGIYGLIFLGYLFGGMAVIKTTSAMEHNETVKDYSRNRKFKIRTWYGLVSYFFLIWMMRIGMWLARMDSIEEEMRSIFQTKFFYHQVPTRMLYTQFLYFFRFVQFGCCGADGPADYSEGDKVGWPKSCYDTVDTYDEYYTEEPQPIEYGCLVAVYKYNAISMAVISGLCLIIWILAVVFPMYLYVYELFICMRARELDPWLEDARDSHATCACYCFRRKSRHPDAPPRDSLDSQD